jgi:hypothetical protein
MTKDFEGVDTGPLDGPGPTRRKKTRPEVRAGSWGG